MHQPSRHRNLHRRPHRTPAATTDAARAPQITPLDKAPGRQRARSIRWITYNQASVFCHTTSTLCACHVQASYSGVSQQGSAASLPNTAASLHSCLARYPEAVTKNYVFEFTKSYGQHDCQLCMYRGMPPAPITAKVLTSSSMATQHVAGSILRHSLPHSGLQQPRVPCGAYCAKN